MKQFGAFLASRRVQLTSLIGVMAALLTVPALAEAQRHTRLSKGVSDHIASQSRGDLNVLYTGPQAEVDRLAASYWVEVVRRLEMGAVLAGNGSELQALASDGSVASLYEDAVVFGTMATSARTTGASALWRGAGRGNFGGLTGRGVTIALIDSGIANHPDIANRVLAS
jgi:subtilisin family serine protease